jgi:hypothetical protein
MVMKIPIWNQRDLAELFTDSEVAAISVTRIKSRIHPFGALLAQSEPTATQAVTAQAFRTVLRCNKPWLESNRRRLLDNDYTSASSVLAEMRAYGALLHAFPDVMALPPRSSGKTPDFSVKLVGGDTMFVEVHAKQWDTDQAKKLENFIQQPPAAPPKGSRIATAEYLSQPFGRPKTVQEAPRNERTIENMVSRIAGIKAGDQQIPLGAVSVLWLDFQDETWAGFGLRDHLYPLISWNGAVSSGGFWHAFYGRKGMSLLEGADVCIGFLGGAVEMQHEGRFYQTDKKGAPTRTAGVVISLPEESAILENPNAVEKLPQEFVLGALEFPWFRIEKSWLNWPAKNLAQKLATGMESLRGLERGQGRCV